MIQTRMLKLPARLLLPLFALPSLAAELELRYAAIERILAEQLFTQDGRHYVRGSHANRCQFAYLEAPHLGSEAGRLRIAARFSGRSALDLFGRCVGLGDSFDLALTATPVPSKGAIAFKDVKVTTVKDSYYIRRVRAGLTQSISKDLKIQVHDQARALLEQSQEKSTYKQELADFDLGAVRVTADALVLVVEFRLVVK